MNVFGVPVDEIAKVSGEIATSLKAGHAVFSIIPPGRDKGAKSKDDRRRAYQGLLVATGDLMTWHMYLGEIAVVMQRPELFAFRHTTTAIHQTADARKSMAAYLAALSEIRLVGNPEPRAAAEEISAILGQLFAVLPTSKKAPERATQIEHTRQWMLKLGEAQKDFVQVARRDLGYAKKLRTRWWQFRRPRAVEEWPGGWPGPTVTLALEHEVSKSDRPAG
ncbi:hypothetical protein ACIA5G_34190 [Amycolatopsis sp. NPDC051758]|uniref:hypothetical protein n=1 Tax=Amycolatopsis sp. NPDC051758 TaxID=3363935 RepID=UPI00379C70D9